MSVSQGTTYEVGDIVSVLDRDGGVYYALIRGFLQDQYAEKYAILTWLLPTQPNPGHFDPSIFVLGNVQILCSHMHMFIAIVEHVEKNSRFPVL